MLDVDDYFKQYIDNVNNEISFDQDLQIDSFSGFEAMDGVEMAML